MIAPSQRLDDIAAEHLASLPVPIRAMLRGIGVSGRGDDARGAALASYLLFEAPYTRELIALGVADTMARRDEVRRVLRLAAVPTAARQHRCGTSGQRSLSQRAAVRSGAGLTCRRLKGHRRTWPTPCTRVR